ncbi:probable sesquiterpene synthase [Cajanus cajan]|nr:probable sesquiterpene synthase [Cajanus cajan]
MVEARWCHEGYIPKYNEYKVNGILTTGIPVLLTTFIGPGEFATKDVFDWIFSDSKIIEVASVIGRFLGDIGSHKFEQQRVHTPSAVECCMNQYGFSQTEAYDHILNDVENCWKIINEACLKSNDIPKVALDCVVNLARSFHFLYGDLQDKFTNSELMKDQTSTLLVDPVCINQHQYEKLYHI